MLAITALILLITSELLHALPDYSSRIPLDKTVIRWIAIGLGLGFAVTVVMRIAGVG